MEKATIDCEKFSITINPLTSKNQSKYYIAYSNLSSYNSQCHEKFMAKITRTGVFFKMSKNKLANHITLVNELEAFRLAAQKFSDDFREFRALAFIDFDDDKRLTDIQMLVDTLAEMLFLEGKILFHKLTEDGKKIEKTVNNFLETENEASGRLVDEDGELKNW